MFKSSELIVTQILLGPVESEVYSEMNHKKINEFLLEHDVQWFWWKRNPPTASNMGGVRECQIRSALSILVALLEIKGTSLND